ncbi:MAG: regulatory protein RecX [Candidatus Omnitrophica bacterium]|nr:regulatory protein RecX [Candidatus Omnitrophota bacterium]
MAKKSSPRERREGPAQVLKKREPAAGGLDESLRYAFLLLKFRPRSVREMEFRLQKKGFSPAAAAKTISFLRDKKFLDDASFARAWAQSRAARSYGLSRIGRELSSKGVERILADKALDNLLTGGYSEEKTAVELVISRKRSLLRGGERMKQRRRLFAFLSRRGFSPEVVADVTERFAGGSCAGDKYED